MSRHYVKYRSWRDGLATDELLTWYYFWMRYYELKNEPK